MKFEGYTSGSYRQQLEYRSFMPTIINQDWSWDDPRLNVLLENANRALGALEAYTKIVPDVGLFIRMHVVKEANTSSRIEGTKTEMDEVILAEHEVPPELRDDWSEVNNYVNAMNMAISELESLPLSLRLLRKTHEILMGGVRGKRKTPGEFRRSQNWIGGSTLADAAFIPPHHLDMPDLLADLELFWHNQSIQVPHLIRVAISHYQFETIHPFLDGNGRIGRLMITLYLVSHGLLDKPSLYLSAYFEQHRGAYYDALTRVRESNDMGHWVRFFLQAVLTTAELGQKTFTDILSLREKIDQQIVTLGRRAENGHKLILYLYENPAITVRTCAKILEIQYAAANRLITTFVNMGILSEATGAPRNRYFIFEQYLDVF